MYAHANAQMSSGIHSLKKPTDVRLPVYVCVHVPLGVRFVFSFGDVFFFSFFQVPLG
jgi:hypothetical protein